MQINAKSINLFAHWHVLGIAMLVFGIVGILDLYQEHERTERGEQERLLAQAHVVQTNLGQSLRAVNQVLLDIRTQLPARQPDRNFNFYLRTLTNAMPGVRNLVVLDAKGNATAASRDELIGRNFADRVYFKEAQRNPDADMLHVSPPFLSVLNIFAIPVTRIIPGPRGEFAGLVLGTLDPEYFAPLLESVRYTPDTITAIVHWNGTRFLVRPEEKGGAEKSLIRPGSFFIRHRESGLEATVFSGTVYANGQQRMMVQRTVLPQGLKIAQPLVVAVSRRLDDIYATWWHDVQMLGLLYALTSLVSIAALYAYHRKLRESNLKEAQAIRQVQESDRFMKTMTDHIPSMVGYWTAELRCQFSNAAYLDWFRKTPEQLHGISMQELLGPELFAQNELCIRAALDGQQQQFERTFRRPDGEMRHVWAQYIPDIDDGKVRGFVALVTDITRLKQVELALAESKWQLKTIIEAEPECVTVIAPDGAVLQMNRAGLDMLGADSETDIIGSRLADMVLPRDKAAFDALHARVNRGEAGILAFELVGRKGGQRWLECHAVAMRDRDGQITGALCVIRDITDRKRAEQELERLAQTDFLTGLANRRHFMALAEQEVSRANRYGGALSVLMMDIDHFKKINDTYGHQSGDRVLQTLADLCRSAVRNVDIIGRLGGEEFAAVLPHTDGKHALEVAERLRTLISQAEVQLDHGLPIHFTLSIGVATRPDAHANIDTLLSWADTALYEAKNAGRNRVRMYARNADLPTRDIQTLT